MATGQSGGANSSTYIPSSKTTLACVKLTKKKKIYHRHPRDMERILSDNPTMPGILCYECICPNAVLQIILNKHLRNRLGSIRPVGKGTCHQV